MDQCCSSLFTLDLLRISNLYGGAVRFLLAVLNIGWSDGEVLVIGLLCFGLMLILLVNLLDHSQRRIGKYLHCDDFVIYLHRRPVWKTYLLWNTFLTLCISRSLRFLPLRASHRWLHFRWKALLVRLVASRIVGALVGKWFLAAYLCLLRPCNWLLWSFLAL